MGLIESMDWTTYSIPGSGQSTQIRTFTRVWVDAIGPSHRRTLLRRYESGQLLLECGVE